MKIKFFFKLILSVMIFTLILFGQEQKKDNFHEIKEGFYFVDGYKKSFSKSDNFKIRIWGEVKNPGIYIIPKYASLIDILSITGGPNLEADLSKIKIINQLNDNMIEKSDFETIINLEYFLQKGKFEVVPKFGNETIVIIPKNKRTKFFDSLPNIINVLNITSLIIILVTWVNKK